MVLGTREDAKIIELVSVKRKRMASYVKETLEYLDMHFS